MSDEEAVRVAGRLTRAQSQLIAATEPNTVDPHSPTDTLAAVAAWEMRHWSYRYPAKGNRAASAYALYRHGLLNLRGRATSAQIGAWGYVDFSPLGLAVRAILKDSPNV